MLVRISNNEKGVVLKTETSQYSPKSTFSATRASTKHRSKITRRQQLPQVQPSYVVSAWQLIPFQTMSAHNQEPGTILHPLKTEKNAWKTHLCSRHSSPFE